MVSTRAPTVQRSCGSTVHSFCPNRLAHACVVWLGMKVTDGVAERHDLAGEEEVERLDLLVVVEACVVVTEGVEHAGA